MDTYGFDTRLRHLERIVAGESSSNLVDPPTSLLQQSQTLNKALQTLYKNNTFLQDFEQKYEPYHILLNPAQSTLEMERELLQPETKLELVMATYDDMDQLARTLQQVKELEHVVNSKDYQSVEQLGSELAPLEVQHGEQATQLAETTNRICTAMDQYNKTIHTLSEIFIAWDDLLSNMEQQISVIENSVQ
ncbi:hypothetical protein DM01DRAFT_1075226 [Hesseltinella vesiculosa]|uniref:Dynactin subunit 3 n=1 Tax=Hesseltinella vesiculosa TaxID=101127 RepID=A0A1X2GW18_9FUNG|nr:hypothetical protein DM01DRAFT_1075226 [Hesseltinella vesiculosa]